jgi:drug/metabolite transporter (DMT)-like permease
MSAGGVGDQVIAADPVRLVAPGGGEPVGVAALGGAVLGFCAVLVILRPPDIEADSVQAILCAIGALLGMTRERFTRNGLTFRNPVTSNLVQNAFGICGATGGMDCRTCTSRGPASWFSRARLSRHSEFPISLTILMAMIRRRVSEFCAVLFSTAHFALIACLAR